jgi:hypothetical protein
MLAAGFTGNRCEYTLNCNVGDTNINQCKSWSSLGFCDLKYLFSGSPIPILCPISCKYCASQCFDSAYECPQWASNGLCATINAQNNGLCRKSCTQC